MTSLKRLASIVVGVFVVLLLLGILERAQAHYDHDSGQPQHFYRIGSSPADHNPFQACVHYMGGDSNYVVDRVNAEPVNSNQTAPVWACYYRHTPSGPAETRVTFSEFHCQPDRYFPSNAAGGTCQPSQTVQAAAGGVSIYHYMSPEWYLVASDGSREECEAGGSCAPAEQASYVNVNLCKLSDDAYDELRAARGSQLVNRIVDACAGSSATLWAHATSSYVNAGTEASGGCAVMRLTLTGGEEYDYGGSFQQRHPAPFFSTSCIPAEATLDCPAGPTTDAIGAWSVPAGTADADAIAAAPSTWCYGSCRHVADPAVTPTKTGTAGGSDSWSTQLSLNGEYCYAGANGADNGSRLAPNESPFGGGGGGSASGGGGSSGGGTTTNNTYYNLDDSNIVAGLAGVSGQILSMSGVMSGGFGQLAGILSGGFGGVVGAVIQVYGGVMTVDASLRAVGLTISDIYDEINGPWDVPSILVNGGGFGGALPDIADDGIAAGRVPIPPTPGDFRSVSFPNTVGAWKAARGEAAVKIARIKDDVAATLPELQGKVYTCPEGQQVGQVNVRFCVSASSQQTLSKVGSVVTMLASLAGTFLVLGGVRS